MGVTDYLSQRVGGVWEFLWVIDLKAGLFIRFCVAAMCRMWHG